MRLRMLLPLVVAVAAISPSGTAHADPTDGPDGVKCGVEFEPQFRPDWDAKMLGGTVFAGPLASSEPGGPADGTLRCLITIDGGTHATGPMPGGTSSMQSTQGVVLGFNASVVIEADPLTAELHLCTSFEFDPGPTFYWDAGTKAWSTSTSVPCAPIQTYATSDPAIHDARMTPCPVFTMVPPVETTLRNYWGCDGNAAMYGRWIGGYALPDV